MVTKIEIGDVSVDVVHKDIKNIHLSVYPPTGAVRISTPLRMDLDTIRVFAISKLGWIKQQQQKLREQERESPREYLERESHYVWGQRYLLQIIEKDAAPKVELTPRQLVLQVRPGADEARKQSFLDEWYRREVRNAVPSLIAKWQPLLDVRVQRFYVQRMKTKWGSCSPASQTIRLNTDLAKKPPECLEYIVVHEMIHLIEPTHNSHFVALMDRFMPQWKFSREVLNRLPLKYESWTY